MAEERAKTTYAGLIKPLKTDYFSIEDQNTNADLIDEKFVEHSERIDAHSKRLDGIETGTRSELISTRKKVTALPNNTLSGGSIEFENIEGLSLSSQLEDNDLENWSRWEVGDLTLSENTVYLTGLGNAINPQIYSAVKGCNIAGRRMFTSIRMRDTKGTANNLRQFLYSEKSSDDKVVGSVIINDPSKAQWYTMSTIVTIPDSYTGLDDITLRATFWSENSEESADTTIEIDMDYGVHCIDVTEYPELTVAHLESIVSNSGHWKGIRSIENIKLMSFGENKCPVHSASVEARQYHSNILATIPVKKNTVYTAWYESMLSGGARVNFGKLAVAENYIGTDSKVQSRTFNTNDLEALDIWMTNDTGDNEVTITGIMLVEGEEIPETYTPYQYDEIDITGALRKLPNGVYDEIEWNEEKTACRLIKRVGVFIVERDNIIFNFYDHFSNTNMIDINCAETNQLNDAMTDYNNSFCVEDFINKPWEDDVLNIGTVHMANRPPYVIAAVLDKEECPDKESAMNKILGNKILYQLAEPQYGQWQNCTLESIGKGDIVLGSDSGLLPQIQYTTPINQGATLKDIAEKVSAHQDFMEKMTGVEVPPKILTNNNPTISFETHNAGIQPIVRGTGFKTTNLIGYIGQFADESSTSGRAVGWTVGNMSGSVPTFSAGKQSISSTIESTGNSYLRATNILESGNYYFYAGTIESDENAIGKLGAYFDNGSGVHSEIITNTTKRVGIKFSTTEENYNILQIFNGATEIESSAIFSEMALYKITESEYNQLTVDTLLEKYPYIIGTQSLSDFSVEIRGANMIHVPNQEVYVDASDKSKAYLIDYVRVPENIDLTLMFSVKKIGGSRITAGGGGIDFRMFEDIPPIKSGWFVSSGKRITATETANGNKIIKTFNTENYRYVGVYVGCLQGNTTNFQLKDFTLVEGSKSIVQYKESFKSTAYFNGNEHFTEHDTFEIENGKAVIKRKWSNPIVIDGNFHEVWKVNTAASKEQYKFVLGTTGTNYRWNNPLNTAKCTKYNGKDLTYNPTASQTDTFINYGTTYLPYNFGIAVSNIDSGWAGSYIPTSDEIKAYFNGWVMHQADGGLYASGSKFWVKRYQGIGTSDTLDFGSVIETETQIATVVPTEKAYGNSTQCYTLQYEFTEPKTYEVDLWGMPTLPEGKCHVTFKSGIRIEKCNFKYYPSSDAWHLNWGGMDNLHSPLSKKPLRKVKVYQMYNGVETDITNKLIKLNDHNTYGDIRWWIAAIDFNENAETFIIYQTLPSENNAGIFSAELTYTDDAQSVVSDLGRTLANTESDLEIAKAQLKELTEEVIYTPTLLNGVTGTDYGIVVKNGEVNGFGALTLNGIASGTTIMNTELFKPSRYTRFQVPSNSVSATVFIDIDASTGDWNVYFSGTVETVRLEQVRFRIKK